MFEHLQFSETTYLQAAANRCLSAGNNLSGRQEMFEHLQSSEPNLFRLLQADASLQVQQSVKKTGNV